MLEFRTDGKGRSTGSADGLRGGGGEPEVSDLSPRREEQREEQALPELRCEEPSLQVLLPPEHTGPRRQEPGPHSSLCVPIFTNTARPGAPQTSPTCEQDSVVSGQRSEGQLGPLGQGAGTGLRVSLASSSHSSAPTYTPGT